MATSAQLRKCAIANLRKDLAVVVKGQGQSRPCGSAVGASATGGELANSPGQTVLGMPGARGYSPRCSPSSSLWPDLTQRAICSTTHQALQSSRE